MDEQRSTIMHIGDWDDEHDCPVGWVFRGPAEEYTERDGDEPLFSGWPLHELWMIHHTRRVTHA